MIIQNWEHWVLWYSYLSHDLVFFLYSIVSGVVTSGGYPERSLVLVLDQPQWSSSKHLLYCWNWWSIVTIVINNLILGLSDTFLHKKLYLRNTQNSSFLFSILTKWRSLLKLTNDYWQKQDCFERLDIQKEYWYDEREQIRTQFKRIRTSVQS